MKPWNLPHGFVSGLVFVSEETVVPEIELVFAISATGTEADEAYRLMKDTLKSMIDEYGSKEINYSVIVYGSSVEQKIAFDQRFSDDEALKESVDKIGRATGVPALVETLEEAKKVFEGSNIRGSSIKVCSEIVAYSWVSRGHGMWFIFIAHLIDTCH